MPKLADVWRVGSVGQLESGSPLARLYTRLLELERTLRILHLRVEDCAYLPGESGGQTLIGGTQASENLILKGTSHATPGLVIIDSASGFVVGATAALTSGVYLFKNSVAGNVVADVWNASATGYSGFQFRNAAGTVVYFFGSDNNAGNIRINAVNNYPMVFLTQSVERLRLDSSGNALLFGATPGTSGVGVFALKAGTAPTTSPADEVQLWVADAAAGDAQLYARNEGGKVNRLTGRAVLGAATSVTSSTTLTDVTALSLNVEASRSYAIKVHLYTTSNVAGGIKVALAGTATYGDIIYEAVVFNGGAVAAQGRATAKGTAVGGVTAVTAAYVVLSGTIFPSGAGTLTVQFAQNASTGAATTVLAGSTMTITPIA